MPFPDFEPCIPALLATVVERFGPREWIVHGERRATYAELERRSAELARGLLAKGVAKGTRVGILFSNSPEWVVCFLAAARIGALVVPLNTFQQPREMRFVLRHADVDTLLMTPSFLSHDYVERMEEVAPSLTQQDASESSLLCPELPRLRRVHVFDSASFYEEDADNEQPAGPSLPSWALAGEALSAPNSTGLVDAAFLREVESTVVPADPLLVIYSSGSTAEPKGAVHTQGSIVRHGFNLNIYRDSSPDNVAWSPMPFFWVGGLVVGLIQTLHEGSLLVVQDVFEAGATLELLERERVSIAMGWPQYVAAMAGHPDFPKRDLSSLRQGAMHGLLPESQRPLDPSYRSNALGMTETCGPHTYDRMDVDLPEHLRGSFGRAVEGMTHKIVDPETGERLPAGEFGEICVRGYSLMQGLYKVERESTFDEEGFYHTGDGGYLDAEGYLFFQARLGEMIKTGGANVTPSEVELVINEQPEVQVAFVVGLPHPTRGQSVAAAVVLNEASDLSDETLIERLRREISAYKIPKHVFFVARSELPFTESGKVRKHVLAELLVEKLAETGSGD